MTSSFAAARELALCDTSRFKPPRKCSVRRRTPILPDLALQSSRGRTSAYILQRGFRGSDRGKLFKFQLWLDDAYDKNEDKRSGKFVGNVRVEGLDITPETSFDRIRSELEKIGFIVTDHPYVIEAAKGEIRIFTGGTTNRIERVETWCSY
jgi:hypothetical protein